MLFTNFNLRQKVWKFWEIVASASLAACGKVTLCQWNSWHLCIAFRLFSLHQRQQQHSSYVHLRTMGVLDGGMCVIAGGRGVGDRESAMFGMQLRPLRVPLNCSASLYHSYIMLHLLCDNLATPNWGISIFSIGLQQLPASSKMLSPMGFWGTFKLKSVTLNRHAQEAWNKVDFLPVAPKKLTFRKSKVFAWLQE